MLYKAATSSKARGGFLLHPYSDRLIVARVLVTDHCSGNTEVSLQERDAVVAEESDLCRPARAHKGVGVAPFVVVEGEEIATNGCIATVHVGGKLVAVLGDIGGGVAYGNAPVLSRGNVCPHVPRDGLDVRSSGGGSVVVDDLVSGEEEKCVAVLLKRVDGGKDVLQVDVVVGRSGERSVDGVVGGVDVEGQVDAGGVESGHASVVVRSVVDGVDTDGVDAQLLELGNVTRASGDVGNGVDEGGGAAGLIVDATDVEPCASSEES